MYEDSRSCVNQKIFFKLAPLRLWNNWKSAKCDFLGGPKPQKFLSQQTMVADVNLNFMPPSKKLLATPLWNFQNVPVLFLKESEIQSVKKEDFSGKFWKFEDLKVLMSCWDMELWTPSCPPGYEKS